MPITYSGQFIGAYGVQAGGVIDYEWVPDPIVFSDKILDVRDQLGDRSLPLLLAAGAISRDIEEGFDTETDPDGQAWAPWSEGEDRYDPVTDKWIKGGFGRGYANNLPPGHSGKILNWRSILKRAATNIGAFVQVGTTINEDSLYFDTGGLPPYWEYHQGGTTKMPQRRFLGIRDDIVILDIFDKWFQGIITDAAISTAGRIFPRSRNPKTGRFQKID